MHRSTHYNNCRIIKKKKTNLKNYDRKSWDTTHQPGVFRCTEYEGFVYPCSDIWDRKSYMAIMSHVKIWSDIDTKFINKCSKTFFFPNSNFLLQVTIYACTDNNLFKESVLEPFLQQSMLISLEISVIFNRFRCKKIVRSYLKFKVLWK